MFDSGFCLYVDSDARTKSTCALARDFPTILMIFSGYIPYKITIYAPLSVHSCCQVPQNVSRINFVYIHSLLIGEK